VIWSIDIEEMKSDRTWKRGPTSKNYGWIFTAFGQILLLRLTNAQVTDPTTLYPRYQANNLVSRFHAGDLDLNVINGSGTTINEVLMPIFSNGIVLVVLILTILFSVCLCVYNCCTCSKFTNRRKFCCGRGCCSVIPTPIPSKWERRGIMFGLVVLLCLGGALVGLLWPLNNAQNEALEHIPNLLKEVTTDLDTKITNQVESAYDATINVSIAFEVAFTTINAEIDATTGPNSTLSQHTYVQDIAIELLRVFKTINESRAILDGQVRALETIATFTIETLNASATSDGATAGDLSATLDDVRAFEIDVADAIETVQEYRDLGFLMIFAIAGFTVCCSFTTAFTDACCKRWDNMHIRTCTCYDHDDATDEDDSYRCALTSAGCSLCGWGRDHCGCSCAVSFWSILIMFILAMIATLALVTSTLGASVCNDPFVYLNELAANGKSNTTSAQIGYYIQCHTYDSAKLDSDFPLNNAASDVRNSVETISTSLEALISDLENAGFNATTQILVRDFNDSLQSKVASLYSTNGVFGHAGPYKCSFLNKYVHEGLIYVCDDLYSSVAMAFVFWIGIAVLLCLTEIGQKCGRREDDEKMSNEFYFETRGRVAVGSCGDAPIKNKKQRKHNASLIATINPIFGAQTDSEVVFFDSNPERQSSGGVTSGGWTRPSNSVDPEADRLQSIMNQRQRLSSALLSNNPKKRSNDIANFKKKNPKTSATPSPEPVMYGFPTQFPPQRINTHQHVREMNVYSEASLEKIDYDFARQG